VSGGDGSARVVVPARVRKTAAGGWARGNAVYGHGKEWVEGQDPASRKGATMGWFRRYRAANGQLYAVLLTAYVFITVLPATLVIATYVDNDPAGLADRVVHRLNLHGSTAALFRDVLTGAGQNQLGATLLAVANVVIFGLGIGRVLQLAHSRSWGIDLSANWLTDQMRYVAALLVLLGLLALYVLQTRVLRGQPSWIEWALLPLWAVAVLGYFVWMPRELLHRRVSLRDVLPGAIFTTLALVGMRAISSLVFAHWLAWYSKYYGGLGIVMALFFWLMIASTILIVAAALSPALAERRDLLEARLDAA
jgi:membrane protein